MRVKKVFFGRYSNETIFIPGFRGGLQSIEIGTESTDGDQFNKKCRVSSLDYDPRSSSVMIRKEPVNPEAPEERGKAARSWHYGDGKEQRCEADFAILNLINGRVIYGDDEKEPQGHPQVQETPKNQPSTQRK